MNDSNDSRIVRLPVREMSDEPAPQRAAQEGDLPPLLTDEQIREVVRGMGFISLDPYKFARAIESEVRTAIAAAGGGVPQGLAAILEDCRNALMECDRDGDYPLIDRIDAALASSTQPEAAPAVAQVPQCHKRANDYCKCSRKAMLCDGMGPLAAAPEAPAQANNLTAELQQRCSDWGVYWRAPDAHGVVLTVDQATELLRDALGVEVEVKAPAQAELTGCSCRWDKDDNRVQTCARHQGWLDVVHEWAARAKDAEWKLTLALEAPAQADTYDQRELDEAAARARDIAANLNIEDPCPGCIRGGVCKKPECGRLKLPTDHPLRTGKAPAQAAQSAGEVERGDVVAFEFYNRATGHAIVDYSVNTHVGNLTADKGYEARPLVYADKREEVTDGSKPIPAWQAREALDELEAAARGDAPFNHQAAAVVRAAISHKEQR